ncbi:unnamed protein product [Ectocarpus sp. 12 AP-2014]
MRAAGKEVGADVRTWRYFPVACVAAHHQHPAAITPTPPVHEAAAGAFTETRGCRGSAGTPPDRAS